MFAGLIAGFKSIRTSLLNGYGLLFFGWLLWRQTGQPLDSLPQSGFGMDLNTLFIRLGKGAQLSALTFAAVVIGSAFDRLAMSRLLLCLETWFGGPLWDVWEEIRLQNVWQSPLTTPSHFFEQDRFEKYQDVGRLRGEARFRLNLLILSPLVLIAMTFEGRPWIWPSLGGLALLVAVLGSDVKNRWDSAVKEAAKDKREYWNQVVAREIDKFEKRVGVQPADYEEAKSNPEASKAFLNDANDTSFATVVTKNANRLSLRNAVAEEQFRHGDKPPLADRLAEWYFQRKQNGYGYEKPVSMDEILHTGQDPEEWSRGTSKSEAESRTQLIDLTEETSPVDQSAD